MSKYRLESRINKLEKAVEAQSAEDFDISSLSTEELAALIVCSIWDLKGICDDLRDAVGKGSPEDVAGLKLLLANPSTNRMILEGWNRYLSKRGIEAPPDIAKRITDLAREGE